MKKFLLLRILAFIPSLALMMIFSFWLARKAPGDPYQIRGHESLRSSNSSPVSKKKAEAIFYIGVNSWESISWLPKITFNGTNNEFHNWSKEVFLNGFGKSIRYRIPVLKVLWTPLGLSVILGFLSISLMLVSSIYLAQHLALSRSKRKNEMIWSALDMIYAVPPYWLGLIFIIFLASPYFIPLFPYGGIGEFKGNIIENVIEFLYHIVLPVLALAIPSIAYYTRLIFLNLEQESRKTYALNAVAKGMGREKVVKTELLRNSVISLASHVPLFISSIVGGSLIIEKIFNLPGMGKLMVEAFNFRDYPLIFGIAFISGLFTLLGYLIADILIQKYSPGSKNSLMGSS